MLDLNDLANGLIPAITPAIGAMLAEAAGVCLESQKHDQNVNLAISGYSDSSYFLI